MNNSEKAKQAAIETRKNIKAIREHFDTIRVDGDGNCGIYSVLKTLSRSGINKTKDEEFNQTLRFYENGAISGQVAAMRIRDKLAKVYDSLDNDAKDNMIITLDPLEIPRHLRNKFMNADQATQRTIYRDEILKEDNFYLRHAELVMLSKMIGVSIFVLSDGTTLYDSDGRAKPVLGDPCIHDIIDEKNKTANHIYLTHSGSHYEGLAIKQVDKAEQVNNHIQGSAVPYNISNKNSTSMPIQAVANNLLQYFNAHKNDLTTLQQSVELALSPDICNQIKASPSCKYLIIEDDDEFSLLSTNGHEMYRIDINDQIPQDITNENCIVLTHDTAKKEFSLNRDFNMEDLYESTATSTMSSTSPVNQANLGKQIKEYLAECKYVVTDNVIKHDDIPIANIKATTGEDKLFQLSSEPKESQETTNFFLLSMRLAGKTLHAQKDEKDFNLDDYALTINLRTDIPADEQAKLFVSAYLTLLQEVGDDKAKMLEVKLDLNPPEFRQAVQAELKLQMDLDGFDPNLKDKIEQSNNFGASKRPHIHP